MQQVLRDHDVERTRREAGGHFDRVALDECAAHGLACQVECRRAQVGAGVLERQPAALDHASECVGEQSLAAPGLVDAHG
jgi:hypothetical protein